MSEESHADFSDIPSEFSEFPEVDVNFSIENIAKYLDGVLSMEDFGEITHKLRYSSPGPTTQPGDLMCSLILDEDANGYRKQTFAGFFVCRKQEEASNVPCVQFERDCGSHRMHELSRE